MLLLAASALPERWEFIWASYGVFLLVFIGLAFAPVIWRKRIVKDLKRYYRRQSLLNEKE